MDINGASIVPQRVNAALAILRVIVGIIFVAHGAQKLFTYGLEGVSGAFAGMGVPMPGIAGPAVAFLEFFGGIALILGLLTRLAALGLAITMLGAIFMVHLAAGFFMPQGYEFVLALFGVAVALAVAGAGEYSVDAVIARRRGDATGRV
jgi:putative oxidoreductase